MTTDDGRVREADQALVASDGAAAHLHPSGFDPSRWPPSEEVLAELKRRHPERYSDTIKLHYTPGIGDGATLEQVVSEFERVDKELENPLICMASRLGGEAFILLDYAQERTDLSGGYPGTKIALTREQKRCARLAALLSECEQLLRDTAIAMEARSVETEGLHPKDDSAGRQASPEPTPPTQEGPR